MTNQPKPKPEQDAKTGRFVPGNNGGGGRPKGSRNKLGEAFIDAMYADFQEHGGAVIEEVRTEKPDQYLKVIAAILPKELNVNVGATDEMSDEQLAELLERVQTLLTSGALSELERVASTRTKALKGTAAQTRH